MELTLSYREGRATVSLPDGVVVDQYAPSEVDSRFDPALFRELLDTAGGGNQLSSENPLIIVNDGFRNTPTCEVLSWLDSVSPNYVDRATALIATGSHPRPTEAHLKKIFGEWESRLSGRIIYHDASDLSSMTVVGQDQFGKDVFLHSEVLRHESVLIIGSVEPHYFAGFTGGRKSLFPGLTDLATIERNHNLASNLSAAPLKLIGNPVAEHFDRLLDLIDLSRYISIQTIISRTGGVTELFAGDIRGSFAVACEKAIGHFAHVIEKQYDLIIAEIRSPLDKNLYQLQKGLENCQGAIRDGGMILLFSACEEGVGSPFFFQLAEKWDRERNCSADGIEHFGSHKLARVNLIGKRIAVKLRSELNDKTVRQVFYEPANAPQEIIDSFLAGIESPRIAIVYDAGHTVLTQENK